MKILIDVLHPAHVHFFRNFIKVMEKKGHTIIVTAREKEIALELLKKYKIRHKKISKIGKNKLGLIWELLYRTWKLFFISLKSKPDIMLGVMGPSIAPVGFFLRIPSIVFYGTENATLTNGYVYRLCTKYITPQSYRKKLGAKNIRYNGNHELAYLHPKYFKPNPKVLNLLGVKKGEKYTIIRFVSWGASHDIGHSGIDDTLKIKAVKEFRKYGKVFITSEKKLPKEIDMHRIKIPTEKIHDAIYYATLLYGESATMASEAAILGTHSIYLDNVGRGFTDEEEKFGLLNNFKESKTDQLKSIKKGIKILKSKNSKKDSQKKSKIMLKNMIDMTKFMENQTNNLINKVRLNK